MSTEITTIAVRMSPKKTTKAARQLARDYKVEMPIVEEVHHILFEGKPPERATADLMLREPKPELWGGTDAT